MLALVSPVRRALAYGADRMPRLVDPVFTAGLALAGVLALFVFGLRTGDAGGDGSSALAIFGVLGRAELDLRPLLDVFAIAACGYLFPMALARGRSKPPISTMVAAALVMGSLVWTVHQADALNRAPTVVRALEHAPFGRIALAALRHATDRDKDGASPWFGGGDCDDRDPRRNPLAFDIPGQRHRRRLLGQRHAAPSASATAAATTAERACSPPTSTSSS